MTDKLFAPLRTAWRAVLARPRLILTAWGGGAVLVVLVYLWLGLPERTPWDLLLSAVLFVLLVAGAIGLAGWTLVAFEEPAPVWASWPRRLGRLAPVVLLMAAAVVLVVWRLSRFSGWLAGAAAILLLLPLASQAARGTVCLRRAASLLRRPEYWLAGVIAILIGVALPWAVVLWTPVHGGLLVETLSLALRFGVAWLAAVASWLFLAASILELSRKSPA